MSLKAVHVAFIVAATLVAGGFGVWSLRFYLGGQPASYLLLALFSLAAAAALVLYGTWFLKKMKDVSYL